MAFSEFYIGTGGNADNGGSDSGAGTSFSSVSSSADGLTLTCGTGWGGTAVGQFVVYDTASAKAWRRVQTVAGNDITVNIAVAVSQSGKTVRVGGAWDKLSSAAPKLTQLAGITNWPTIPPRVNVDINSGTPYSETGPIATLGTWTRDMRLRIEGYKVADGVGALDTFGSDLSRAVFDFGALGNTGFTTYGAHVTTVNCEFRHSGASASFSIISGFGTSCTFMNCKFLRTAAGAVVISATNRAMFERCYIERTVGGSANMVSLTSTCKFSDTEFVGPGSAASGQTGSCLSSNAGVTATRCIFKGAKYAVNLNPGAVAVQAFDHCAFYDFANAAFNIATVQAVDDLSIIESVYQSCVATLENNAGGTLHVPCIENSWRKSTALPASGFFNEAHNSTDVGSSPLMKDPANGDYRIDTTSPASKKGFPGVFLGGGAGRTGYMDPGPFQRDPTGTIGGIPHIQMWNPPAAIIR